MKNDSESVRIVKYYRGSILLSDFQRDSVFSTKGSFGHRSDKKKEGKKGSNLFIEGS